MKKASKACLHLATGEIHSSDPKFKSKLEDVTNRFRGKSGDPESETIICLNKQDLTDGYVTLGSSNKDITNIIERCPSAIISILDQGETVQLKVSKRVFRGAQYIFKVGK